MVYPKALSAAKWLEKWSSFCSSFCWVFNPYSNFKFLIRANTPVMFLYLWSILANVYKLGMILCERKTPLAGSSSSSKASQTIVYSTTLLLANYTIFTDLDLLFLCLRHSLYFFCELRNLGFCFIDKSFGFFVKWIIWTKNFRLRRIVVIISVF